MTAHNKELLIAFDPEKCTQCTGCQTACKSWRDLPLGVNFRRVLNLWEGGYPKVKSTSVSMSCLHCVTPACAAACPEEAIAKQADNGLVVVDSALCTGCGLCAEACPYGVPQFGANDKMVKCDLCPSLLRNAAAPPCVETCPGKALTLISISASEKLLQEEQSARLLSMQSHT
jgi:anaerobic dimethyl sulfoxide reductase subunit B (iron-sulfur subunit)